MKKIFVILIAILFGCGAICFAQGQISRPTQQHSRVNKPKKSRPKVAPVSKPAQQHSQVNKQNESRQKVFSVTESDSLINGFRYVDLGLPSGTKWATCNIGAASPSDDGFYFAWGETSPKASYNKDNSLTYCKSVTTLESDGIINYSGRLTKFHDAASSNWGAPWRMPTKEEFSELVDKCKWEWTERDGKNGYNVIGPNGRFIFLPAAGYRIDSIIRLYGHYGAYWSSSVGAYGAFRLGVSGLAKDLCVEYCVQGLPVRPVTD